MCSNNVSHLAVTARPAARGTALTPSSWLPFGTNVLDREWGLLVVFDTCRPDATRAVADEYAFVSTVEAVTSVASCAYEWTAATRPSSGTTAARSFAWGWTRPSDW